MCVCVGGGWGGLCVCPVSASVCVCVHMPARVCAANVRVEACTWDVRCLLGGSISMCHGVVRMCHVQVCLCVCVCVCMLCTLFCNNSVGEGWGGGGGGGLRKGEGGIYLLKWPLVLDVLFGMILGFVVDHFSI